MKRRILGAAIAALCLAGGGRLVAAEAPMVAKVPFQPSDVFRLNQAGTPRFSPDGKTLVYVRTTQDIMIDDGRRALWLIDLATGDQTPLASDVDGADAPRWSPDGSRIAFVGKGRDGSRQIFVVWPATGRVAQISTLAQAPTALSWSPDGRTLAFVRLEAAAPATLGVPLEKPEGAKWADPIKVITGMDYRADGLGYRLPGRKHLFVMSADGGEERQLTSGPFEDSGPLSWSPDGGDILFTSHRRPDWEHDPLRSRVYRVSVSTRAVSPLSAGEGPDADPVYAPDGRHVAFLTHPDRRRGYENTHVWIMDRDGGGLRDLTPGSDRSFQAPVWSSDGQAILAGFVDHGVSQVGRIAVAGGALETVASGLVGDGLDLPYTGSSFDVARNGTLAVTAGDAEHPADIAVVRKGTARRLTDLNGGLLASRTLSPAERITVPSTHDGKPVDGWILRPPNFDPRRKYPLILEIHGGPYADYGPAFSSDDQLYAAAGYVVVYANPRGSTSYGAAFANEIEHAYPGHDYDDLMSVVDGVIARGNVDPGRLFVTGGSGGGVLSAWIVGKTQRFRAAAVQKPVVNWSSEILTNDLFAWMGNYWFGKYPWEDPASYWALSPLSLVDKVKTPTLVVVGEHDLRTPPAEAEQYYNALQLLGVPSELVRVPGAFHDMAARPSHSAAKSLAILAWFARYDTEVLK